MLISCFQLLKTTFEFAIPCLFVIESARLRIQLRPQISDLLLIERHRILRGLISGNHLSIPLFCLLQALKVGFYCRFLVYRIGNTFRFGDQ